MFEFCFLQLKGNNEAKVKIKLKEAIKNKDAIVLVSKPVTIASLQYTKHDLQQHKSILRSTMFIYLLSYSRYAINMCEQ